MKFTWSHSRLKDFETCPAFYEAKYIKKIQDPPGESAIWGDRVHKDLEASVRDDKPMPEATKVYEWATVLGKTAKETGADVRCEWKMGLTVELKPCGFNDGNVWLRGIADLAVVGDKVASIWDYKSGRPRQGNQQLEIMAAMVFEHKPVERVEAKFLWLQTKKATGESYNRDGLPVLWEGLLGRVHRMERAHQTDVFPMVPSWKCKFCPVRTCPHNRSKK